MKNTFLTLALVVASCCTFAQRGVAPGIQIASTIGTMYGDDDISFSYSAGMHLLFRRPLVSDTYLFVIPSLDYAPYYQSIYSTLDNVLKTKNKYNYFRFSMPVDVNVGPFLVGAGPFYSVLSGARSKIYYINDEKEKVKLSPAGQNDYGFVLDISAVLPVSSFSLGYYSGMNKDVKSRTFTFTYRQLLSRMSRY